MLPELDKGKYSDRDPEEQRIVRTGATLLDQVLAGAMASDYPTLPRSKSENPRSQATWQQAPALLILTLALVTAIVTAAGVQQSRSHALDSQTNAELASRVEAERTAVSETEKRNAALAASNRAMAARILGQSSQGVALQKHISATGPFAAVTPITGPAGCTTFWFHGGQPTDRYVHAIANYVWRSGPVGVTVGGIRLSSTSAIRTAGSQVLVAYEPIASPLKVCAVYPPSASAAVKTNFRTLDRFASAIGAQARHNISIMTLPAASDRATKIRVASAQ